MEQLKTNTSFEQVYYTQIKSSLKRVLLKTVRCNTIRPSFNSFKNILIILISNYSIDYHILHFYISKITVETQQIENQVNILSR